MRKGWQEVRLGDIADVYAGGTPSTKEPSYWGGEIEWITPTDLTTLSGSVINGGARAITPLGLKESSARTAPRGSVLVSSRATIGATAIAGRDVTVNQGVTVLVPSDVVDGRWLYYWVHHTKPEMIARASGTTFLEISRSKMRELTVVLPPIEEQRRIADLLGSPDEVVRRRTEERVALEQLKAAEAMRLFAFDGTDGVAFAGLLAVSIGGVWGERPGVEAQEVAVYRSTDFSNSGTLTTGNPARRSVSVRALDSRRLEIGDILLEKSGGGPKQPVGRVVRVRDPLGNAVCGNFIQLLRPQRGLVDPDWLFYALWASHARGDTLRYQSQTTGIRNLRTKDYLHRGVHAPELGEQRRVANRLNAIDAAIEAVSANEGAIRNLRTSLLSTLLAGTHDVPQSYDRFVPEDDVAA